MGTKEDNTVNAFDTLVRQIDLVAGDVQRERGTLFEKLVVAYLKHEPLYKNLYTDVWMLSDVPTHYEISRKDTGVDIVARSIDGSLTAVQAKFYRNKIGKSQIDSFMSELGKSYYSSGLIISTIDEWNSNAEATLDQQSKQVQRIGLSDLRNSQIDWTQFSFEHSDNVKVKLPKKIRPYQEKAIQDAVDYFRSNDRGQLIMAPGTGKTFTSLKLTERMVKQSKSNQFKVLYLVPSIQLLTQTLRGWNNDTELTITNMAVTSDRNASRVQNSDEDIKPDDIGFPATTSEDKLIQNWNKVQNNEPTELFVTFSTYQSIDVISKAQKLGFPDFDLIIADEAHKTTGAQELGKEFSPFTKVHDNNVVRSAKRLYQTATPKLYGLDAKRKAAENSIVISSMDDKDKYGEVIFRLGFGEAVIRDILTDYKLMVLAVDETSIQQDMQKTLSDPENGLNIDDVGRIIGVWNAMMKRNSKSVRANNQFDGSPMRRAIAFTSVIDSDKSKRDNSVGSKQFARDFESIINDYLGDGADDHMTVSVKHADGSMNALQKADILSWLADNALPENEARIVSNVKFLTEGIDVPTLDAVIFLSPKRSQVDIVQAIGRIMRKAEGKDYGYIILPIVVPSGETPESILDNNKRYDVIWQVMNALRSVDERFEATINKLQLNKSKPKNIDIIGISGKPQHINSIGNSHSSDDGLSDNVEDYSPMDDPNISEEHTAFNLQWDEMREAIYGKIVTKIGDRKYLEDWSDDVAKIAGRYINWINTKLVDKKDPVTIEFQKFINSLKHNINDSIDQRQAVEMLAQHLITKPVFEALFDEYSFVNSNPVSHAMENIIVELEKAGFTKEQKDLAPFYESVRIRAEGIDNAEAKQKIIVTLYEKFFSKAFKSTTDRLGIVFTPIEVVDFIVKSVDDVLQKHFNKTLASEGVHILDPFTGTGTFITRTLTYLKEKMDVGEITLADITRKFTQELHANEIVLLSYYIAAINIESTFDEINGDDGYKPFEGIVLTDTFESTENEDTLDDTYFGTNDERLKRQQEVPITVIMGNPPYSTGQQSTNDDSQNMHYRILENTITQTYAKYSKAGLKQALYDSYIKSFRWASNRISEYGIIGFVSNGSFIDSQSTDGFRKILNEEFNHLYIFNLRGDQRTQGETSRKEGGKIFGSGSRTPIAISILVKDGSGNHEVNYYDIGDYLTRDDKLRILSDVKSIEGIHWQTITPDKNNDWINQRDENYESYISVDNEQTKNLFDKRSMGISSNRDAFVIGFSKDSVIINTNKMVDSYNSNVQKVRIGEIQDKSHLNRDETKIKWTDGLEKRALKGIEIVPDDSMVRIIQYRPFTKKYVYFQRELIHRPRQFEKFNLSLMLYISGLGTSKPFASLVIDNIPDLHLLGNGQAIPLDLSLESDDTKLFEQYSNVNSIGSKTYSIDDDQDIFYYVYGVLHSPEYREKYANDLQKSLPHIPLLKNKEMYVEIGHQLADLHLNYENQANWDGVEVQITGTEANYRVKKMKHSKKSVLDTIIYNDNITVKNIPAEAYDYVVNGRPAIEWIIDQYQIKTDKKSGITDDPNAFSNNPKYILHLLLSVITVSMKTLELIDRLPEFEVEE